MTKQILPIPTSIHWGYFDAALPSVAKVEPGEIFVLNSVSGAMEDLPPSGQFTVRPELTAIHDAVSRELGPHILTGPIEIKGARPGDALRVEILDVQLADDWGYNVIKPGAGALPDDFPYERRVHFGIDRVHGMVHTPWGMQLPARPFFGVMGTAPAREAGRITSIIPGSFGGNIDNKEIGAGSVLYLPVAVDGGMFSVGDGHAVQGDGEVCLTAVETGLTGTFKIDIIEGANLDAPHAETNTHFITMAFDEDLNEAVKTALRRMITFIVAKTGITADDAYRLCSLAADLRVTQVVNRKKGIHVMLPRAYLGDHA